MNILVLNSGSSSIKYKLLDIESERVIVEGIIEHIGESHGVSNHSKAFEHLLNDFDYRVACVVHRVVHGAEEFKDVTLITDAVKEGILELSSLAPLHNPANLEGIKAAQTVFNSVAHYAVFDTSFHQSMPLKAFKYALPSQWYENYKIRRYGFHGNSHEYIASHFKGQNIITIHLGNGASMCAISDGKSIDTSMGFTPLEGLVMGTRSGDIDAGIIKYMSEKVDVDYELNHKSGLKGLCGENDMRTILANQDKKEFQEALDIYIYRIKKYIGAYAVALGSLDAIVFTAGVGENSSEVREKVCENMGILNIKLDKEKNRHIEGDVSFVAAEGSVKIAVIKTDEELMMAKKVYNTLKRDK